MKRSAQTVSSPVLVLPELAVHADDVAQVEQLGDLPRNSPGLIGAAAPSPAAARPGSPCRPQLRSGTAPPGFVVAALCEPASVSPCSIFLDSPNCRSPVRSRTVMKIRLPMSRNSTTRPAARNAAPGASRICPGSMSRRSAARRMLALAPTLVKRPPYGSTPSARILSSLLLRSVIWSLIGAAVYRGSKPVATRKQPRSRAGPKAAEGGIGIRNRWNPPGLPAARPDGAPRPNASAARAAPAAPTAPDIGCRLQT